MSKYDGAAVAVLERSADIDESSRYLAYLHTEHANSAWTSNAWYTEFTEWKKLVMYNLRRPEPSVVLTLFREPVLAAL